MEGRVSSPLNTNRIAPLESDTFLDDQFKPLQQKQPLTTSSLPTAYISTQRIIHVNTTLETVKPAFISNSVRTAKYSAITFLPKSLLWQFRRAANVYFLIISVLTAQHFSPKNPLSMIGTFAWVLIFTMLKEAYEDAGRHKQDRIVNNRKATRLDQNGLQEEVTWAKINVGDIVKWHWDEEFPADIIFLTSSEPSGLAFVDTMNLDGETNLKERLASEITRDISENKLRVTSMEFELDKPSMTLIRWNCKAQIALKDWTPLHLNQLLLRGCVLKNTSWIYGVVAYSGHETKMMLNSKKAQQKQSHVLKKMNAMLYSVFLFQAVICFSFAVGNITWQSDFAETHSYLSLSSNVDIGAFFIGVLTFLVAYSHLIPISLYVALEVVKLALAYLIGQDIDMYYEPEDRPALCRTSDLVEELGQVGFVFSDKTGTLTQNVMEFRKWSISGTMYSFNTLCEGTVPLTSEVDTFFKHMALCHTVFPSISDDESQIPKYQAASPDELALVQAAAKLGFVFKDKTSNWLYTSWHEGNLQAWKILWEIPFDSTRKRMSLVLQDGFSGQILLLTKGADTIMWNLVSDYGDGENAKSHVDHFAWDGLRTLVMGQRVLQPTELDPWLKKWNELQLSSSENKDELLAMHGSLLEKDLSLVGVSAIEDKLQDGVPNTIALLLSANIKLWVLTGDKQETAVEIGKSCNLIEADMHLLDLSSDTPDDLDQKLQGGYSGNRRLAIVINGQTLAWALMEERASDFFQLGLQSASCICCRVSPAQKAQVVALAKAQGSWITLAIGDGANDVSMIQEAHIGVGIAGKEGTQALRASDYSFAQFSFLGKLLLVHGRWGYRRVTQFICYYFYKNIWVVFTELWFAMFTGFSGQIYFLDWLPMLYNAFWTSWLCIITYIFEQDLTVEQSLDNPKVYAYGQKSKLFGFRVFWVWVGLAAWHGLIWFFVPNFGLLAVDKDLGLWWISTISFTLIIHVVTIKLFVESIYWTWMSLWSAVGSVIFYYLTVIVLNTNDMAVVFQPQLNQLFYNCLNSGQFWLLVILAPALALLPDLVIKMYAGVFRPSMIQRVMSGKRRTRLKKENSILPLNSSKML